MNTELELEQVCLPLENLRAADLKLNRTSLRFSFRYARAIMKFNNIKMKNVPLYIATLKNKLFSLDATSAKYYVPCCFLIKRSSVISELSRSRLGTRNVLTKEKAMNKVRKCRKHVVT